MKVFGISWRIREKGKLNGILEVSYDKRKYPEVQSIKEWGELALREYIGLVMDGEVSSSDSFLAYYIRCGVVKERKSIELLSVFRIVKDRKEIENKIDDKTKEKIQKLLNLSMSDNGHEAKLASTMAYKLMKKHSLTHDDISSQDIISINMRPKGKKVSTWEILLYQNVAKTSGCFFTFHKGYKSTKEGAPNISPKLSFTGYERDAVNASYLVECYLREIESMVAKKKATTKMTVRTVNDYRMGLISGIGYKLIKDAKTFFNQVEDLEGGANIVPLDDRIDKASKLFITETKNRGMRKVGSAYFGGEDDAEKIVIRKATEHKTKAQKGLLE